MGTKSLSDERSSARSEHRRVTRSMRLHTTLVIHYSTDDFLCALSKSDAHPH
jgi:hypothetical protein